MLGRVRLVCIDGTPRKSAQRVAIPPIGWPVLILALLIRGGRGRERGRDVVCCIWRSIISLQ